MERNRASASPIMERTAVFLWANGWTEFPPALAQPSTVKAIFSTPVCGRMGKRCGSGTEFDENGEIVFSGEWKDGKYHNGILYKKLTKDELSEASGQAPGQS